MNFNLNDEQQLLQDSVRRFIDKAYAFETRNAIVKAARGGNAENWRMFADNGWLAAALPEAYGGLGGTLLDTALITQQFGRALVVEPYLGCAVLAAQTLVAAAGPAVMDTLLPAIADGSQRVALAYSEAASRGDPAIVQTTATCTKDGYRIDGTKTLVLGAADADWFIVSARVADGASVDDGVSLFLLRAGSPGLTQQPLPLHDGTHAAELTFAQVAVPASALLGERGAGLRALRHGLSHGITALCAELVGAMERAIEITAEYLKVRKQFGVAIGSFQSLQHRMADMAAELELSRSMLYAMLAAFEGECEKTQRLTVSQGKAFIGRAAKWVCGQAIQLHGGIGMTEEYAVGHYFKRAIVADILFGTSDQHEAANAVALQEALRAESEAA
ncbi:acyl-CoA dehydrogenase family protein [Caballeronia sp. ATUFL_M2_KS44]|uniref:acyl-CoA dehydrogenase family protein n=1 Tax=Caballeronia sp. ATUFL_M2_KS44 TaxID=2921767 RepID=UPI0020278E83|nr:acyl-CoA dehydrogenase family protein [Caballeronia sp. ATUFL_M2_KS44]